jgi:preprotein translocase subunit SecA
LLTGVRPPVLCARADIRRQLWEYDQVLNTQRDRVYLERRRALLSRDLSPLLLEYAERTVDDILEARALCQKPCQKS